MTSYCGGDSGIHLLNQMEGEHPATRLVANSPSFFLAAHPGLPVLYSVDAGGATLTAFLITADGSLHEIKRLATAGEVPCHLAIEPSGRYVVVAAYHGGIELYPLSEDGGVEPRSALYQPVGTGPVTDRQEKSHPHGVSLAGALIYVADLGADRIFVLEVTHSPVRFKPRDDLAQTLAPGAGPRHFELHCDGRQAVCVNELDNTVTRFRRDPAFGGLQPLGSASTLPPDFRGTNSTAEIGYHPTAPVFYASNRGHDSLAVFNLDGRFLQFIAAGEGSPQHFLVDSSGRWLLIAHSDSDRIVRYKLDPGSGLPQSRLSDVKVRQPMCLLEWKQNRKS